MKVVQVDTRITFLPTSNQRYIKEIDLLQVAREIYRGILGKNSLGYRYYRSKYLKEVILKIKLLYKSSLCIFNFVGPGYFNPLGIRNDLFYILIVSGPTKLNMQRLDL